MCGSLNSACTWLIDEICRQAFLATAVWNEINLQTKCVQASFSSICVCYLVRCLILVHLPLSSFNRELEAPAHLGMCSVTLSLCNKGSGQSWQWTMFSHIDHTDSWLGQLAVSLSPAEPRLCKFWMCRSLNSACTWLIDEICRQAFLATAVWNEINLSTNQVHTSVLVTHLSLLLSQVSDSCSSSFIFL